jgi:PEGA domain
MIRVLSSACVVLLLLSTGGKVWAGGKTPIAILGLEVYDNGNGIDPETTRAAKEITAALRDRAKAGTGPYAPVASEKELIDEKLLNNCDTEAAVCMAAIGTELQAEAVLYGKIEKITQTNPPSYRVSLKLLNVNRKQLVSSTVETLPLAGATGTGPSTYAKAWYAKLVGINTGGTVVVKANIDRGTVMLDEEAKGNLASGTLTLSNVPEGRHTLAIEAKDYQRYEASITVRNGETLPHNATLAEMSKKTAKTPKTPKPPPTSEPSSKEATVATTSGSNIWKPVFYGSAVVAAGAAGFSVVAITQSNKEANQINQSGITVSQKDCGGPVMGLTTNEQNHLNSACSWHTGQIVGWVVTGVAGAAAISAFYMAFLRDRDHTETRTANGGHRKRRELAVTPIITPDGGGATLRFDW